MTLIGLAIAVIALAVVVQVVVMVPTVRQLGRTLSAAENFYRTLEGDLKTLVEDEIRPLVRTLNETAQEVGGVAKGARSGFEKVDNALSAFHEMGDTIRSINVVLDKKLKQPLVSSAAWLTGFRVGLETLITALRHHKQKEVQE